jgi:LemA protein
MDPLTLVLVVLAGIVVLAVLIAVYYFNRIISLENTIDNSWAQIDVQLKRRTDLIPNLMESVKGYMKHERGVLEGVTKARTAIMSAKTPDSKMKANDMLSGALKSLFAVAESYPDLKASTNFLQLQDELTNTENKISFSRQHFNDTILVFNNTIETIPGNIFAGFMGKKTRDMLKIEEVERKAPKVKF